MENNYILNNNYAEIQQNNSIIQYDSTVKKVLSTRIYLAEILKDVVPEYANVSRREIMQSCFDGEIQIGPLVDDVKITGQRNEDDSPNEGSVRYDIKFTSIVPGINNKIRLIINLEAQKSDKLSYPLVKRGNYYTARMISSQKNTVFVNNHYEDICKVYSIWIVMNSDKDANTVVRYHMHKDDVVGNPFEYVDNYDLQNIIVIKLGDADDISCEENADILKFLDVLLSMSMGVDDKIRILEEDFNIPMTTEVEKGVNDMCNLGEGIYENGLSAGIAEGTVKGRIEGREEGVISTLLDLVKDGSISKELAAQKANKSVEEIEDLMREKA